MRAQPDKCKNRLVKNNNKFKSSLARHSKERHSKQKKQHIQSTELKQYGTFRDFRCSTGCRREKPAVQDGTVDRSQMERGGEITEIFQTGGVKRLARWELSILDMS